MNFKLAFYLILRKLKYRTKLDYRLTPMELYEIGASDVVVMKYLNWYDNKQIGG